jgi:hypothetical protein
VPSTFPASGQTGYELPADRQDMCQISNPEQKGKLRTHKDNLFVHGDFSWSASFAFPITFLRESGVFGTHSYSTVIFNSCLATKHELIRTHFFPSRSHSAFLNINIACLHDLLLDLLRRFEVQVGRENCCENEMNLQTVQQFQSKSVTC